MQISTLRPGLLVSLSTTVKGGVEYRTQDIDPDHVVETGARVAKWETERTVSIPEEHERAIKVRSRARALITGMCSQSTFGLLCPETAYDALQACIEDAQRLADEFNRTAELTRVNVYVILGRVAQDDVQAVRAINSEVRDLMEAMERGLQNLDVKTVRDAANKARNIGAMLSPAAEDRIKVAIDAARSAARKIVKAAETGAAEIDQAVLTKIRQSRTAFLDIADDEIVLATPEAGARAIDLEIDEAPAPAKRPRTPKAKAPAIELETA